MSLSPDTTLQIDWEVSPSRNEYFFRVVEQFLPLSYVSKVMVLPTEKPEMTARKFLGFSVFRDCPFERFYRFW